jgi:hypothetical protein
VILGLAQDARNDAALLGNAQALVGAQLFDVDLAMHDVRLGPETVPVKHAVIPALEPGSAFFVSADEKADPGSSPG